MLLVDHCVLLYGKSTRGPAARGAPSGAKAAAELRQMARELRGLADRAENALSEEQQ